MKTLYLIGGTMGVGKTATARCLRDLLPHAVMLDGDWCWDARPFVVTDETRALVLDNICHLLGNFLRCSAYENIVFSWVMHEQAIVDEIAGRLPLRETACRVVPVSLVCSEAELRRRLDGDIRRGLREPEVVGRSVARLPLYGKLRTHSIDTTDRTPEQAARAIAGLAPATR